MKRRQCIIGIAFLFCVHSTLVSTGFALRQDGDGGIITVKNAEENCPRSRVRRDVLDDNKQADDGTDEPDVLEEVGVVAKEILDILKEKMEKGEPTTNLGHDGGDTVFARMGEDATMKETIPITDLPEPVLEMFRRKAIKKIEIRPYELPNYVYQLFKKKMTEHHFDKILLSRNIPLGEIPVWAIQLFTVKPTGNARDVILSYELPGWVIDQMKRWMDGKNDDTFKLTWNEMPLWMIKLVKTMARHPRGTADLFSQRMTLEELLRWSIYTSRPKFEGAISGIKISLDDIPKWAQEFLKFKLKKVGEERNPMNIYVTLGEIFEWAFMITRRDIIDSIRGNLLSKFAVKWTDFPGWFQDWLGFFLKGFKFPPFHVPGERPGRRPGGRPPGEILPPWPKERPYPGGRPEGGKQRPPGHNKNPPDEKPPWSERGGGTLPPTTPVPAPSPKPIVKPYWLDLIINKKLKENDGRLELSEMSDWIMLIMHVKILQNFDNETVLGVRISLNEIIDWGVHIAKLTEQPNITLEDLPPWFLLILQKVVEEYETEVQVMMFSMMLDELIDWSIKYATDEKEGNLGKIKFERLPEWLKIYISMKIERSNDPDQKPPWSPIYVPEVRDVFGEKAFKVKRALKGLPKLLIVLIQMRIEDFYHGENAAKFILAPQEIPAWAVELVKIKVQKNYGVSLIMPEDLTWDTTPRWVIELIKGKIYEDSIQGSLMESYVTLIEIVDFSIWFTNMTINGSGTQTHSRVSLEDIPDWVVDLLRTIEEWQFDEDLSVMEEYITLSELLDWAIVHNLRRKWESDGDKILMFKDNLSKLPKWGADLLASKLISFNNVMPPMDFDVPVVDLPNSATEYLKSLIRKGYSGHPDMKPGLTPDKLPYWSLELLQRAMTEHVDVASAMKKSWTIDEILQWVVWVTRIKSFDMDPTYGLRVAHLPDWIIELLKTKIEESNGDTTVMEHRITTEEILAWAIRFILREKEEVVPLSSESTKHPIEMPDWMKSLLLRKTEEVNQGKMQKIFTMPTNQLPLWSMEIIEVKLEMFKEVDVKIIPFTVIQLLQSRLLEFNGSKDVYDLDVNLGDVVDWFLWMTRARKIATGVNSNVTLGEIPKWVVRLLTRKREMHNDGGDVFDLVTTLDEIIDLSIQMGKEIVEEREEDNEKRVNGLPYWLVRIILLKLKNDYSPKFGKRLGKLPLWAIELIFLKLEVAYEYEFGIKTALPREMEPDWLMTFLALHINFEDQEESVMFQNVTLNELLEFAIWSGKRERTSISFFELPEWIFDFLIIKLEENENDRTILKRNMTLYEILDLGLEIFVKIEVERKVHLGQVMMATPIWIKDFLKDRIRLINSDKIQYQLILGSLNKGDGGIVMRKVKEIYSDNIALTTLITAPYWIIRFVEMQTEQQKSDTDAILLQEVIDFGLWITRRIKNLEIMNSKRKLRLFDVPLWLLELLNMKAEVYGDEEALLQDQMTLEQVVIMSIKTSITIKTFEIYDFTPPDLELVLDRIPSWIQEVLRTKVEENESWNEQKAYQFPNNQLPIWVVDRIEYMVELKHREIRKIKKGTTWDSVPYWATLILQSIIQENNGSVAILEREMTVEEVVDWAIWITNETKARGGIKSYMAWTEIPEWVVDILKEKRTDRDSRKALMKARLTLESLLDWAIDRAILTAELGEDAAKLAISLEGIPGDVLRFIIMTINNVNQDPEGHRYVATRGSLPRWAGLMIERLIRAIHGNNPLMISIVAEEISGSWVVEYFKVIIYRFQYKDEVVNYRATLKEIIEFAVRYTYHMINGNGAGTRRNIAIADLPEWLIRFIRFRIIESDDVEAVLVDFMMVGDILHWSIVNNIAVQTMTPDDFMLPDLSKPIGPPPWVINIIVHEIGTFYVQRHPRPEKTFNDISIWVVQIFENIVVDRHKKIDGGEEMTTWGSIPYWLIKFLQAMQVRHRGSPDIISVKITIREVINWLIEWIQDTYTRLGVGGRVEWKNFPPWLIELFIKLEKEMEDPNKILEQPTSVGDMMNFGIGYHITLYVKKNDRADIKRLFPELPGDLIENIFVIIFDFNDGNGVPDVEPNSPPLSANVFDLFERVLLDLYGDMLELRLLIKWKVSRSWFAELIRWLINGGIPEGEILTHKLSVEEIIRYYLLYLQIIYDVDGMNDARDGRLIDFPEWLIKLIIFRSKSGGNIKPTLESDLSLKELFVWIIENSPPLGPKDIKIPDRSTERPETPPWIISILVGEIERHDGSNEPPKLEPPISIVILVCIVEIGRERYDKLEGGEPESVWDYVPNWLISFLQAILWRENGRRNLMQVEITIREIVQWWIWWIRSIKENSGSEGNVEWENFPPWLIELLIRSQNPENGPSGILDSIMPVEELVVIVIDYGIKDDMRKRDLERVKAIFEGISDVILIEILRIVRAVNEEFYDNTAVRPEYPDLPSWAITLIQTTVADTYADEPGLAPFIASETIPHCIIELMKELIHRLKTERLVMKYRISMREFVKFSAVYTHYIYNVEGTNVLRELRLTDLPGWLMNLIMFMVQTGVDPKSLLDENLTIENLLTSVIDNTLIVNTLKTEDFEISSINIAKQPEWLIQYLQILINKHYEAMRPRNYVLPKNQLPVWVIRMVEEIVRIELIELEYEEQDWTLDSVPYWVVQFIELMLEKHKGSSNVMNTEILISEAVTLAIWRTQNLKLYLDKEGKVELHELPEWLIEYIRDVGEGVNMNYLLVEGTATVGQIVEWGISHGISRKRNEDDFSFVLPLVEGVPEVAIRYIMFQLVQVNRYRDRERYNTSVIVLPQWAERTVRRIVKEYYGENARYNTASILETTPYWLLGLFKIHLHKYDKEQSLWRHNMNLKEIIDYAVWLTKHVNDLDGVGVERNIRFIDIPEWLIEIIQMKAEYPKADILFLDENLDFIDLLSWGIRNSIRGKIFRYEDQTQTNETVRPIPDWIAELLMVKIDQSNKGQLGKDFKIPMNHLPLWAVEYIRIKVKEKYEAYQEEEPEAIWGSLPYWVAQLMQSKIQEHNNSIAVMGHQMTVEEVVDWAIWVSSMMERGGNEVFAVTDMPRWLIELLEMTRGQNGKVENVMRGKLTLERVLWWGINVTITEKLEKYDLSDLRLTLKGIPRWVIELIQLWITMYNGEYPSNTFDSNISDLPPMAQNRLIKVIDDLYGKKPSPVLIEQATPHWIKVLLLYKVNQLGSNSSVLEGEVTMNEIMEFTLWLTQRFKNETRNYEDKNRLLVRFIELPYWFIELVKSIVPGNDDAEKLMNHRIKLDQLLIWAIRNSLVWRISGGDTGVQPSPNPPILEIPEWLREELDLKIDRDYGKYQFRAPINQLPVWIVEQIYKNNEEIGEIYVGTSYNITIPFWVIELIQVMTRSSERLTEVMDVSIQIDLIADWAIWDTQRKKDMEGKEGGLTIDEIPRWLIQLIVKIKEYKDPKEAMKHTTSLRYILAGSVIILMEDKKEFERVPDWIIRILRAKIVAINDPKVPMKFEVATNDLPGWVLELFRIKVEEHYANAPGVTPVISLDTVPQWLVEYLKIKISENDIGLATMRRFVTRDEFLDFSVWFTKQWMVTDRDLIMDDVPMWTLDFIRTKVLTVGEDERALMRMIALYEITDWAIWYGVKKELENEGLWDPKSHRGLPFWLAHYLLVKIQDFNRGIVPTKFHMPNNMLPPWAVRIVKSTIKQVYEENTAVIPSLSWSTVSYWSLELFQSILEKYNGHIEALSDIMELEEIVEWSIWITKMRYMEMGMDQKLTVDDIPAWVIELLLMNLEGNRNDRSILKHRMEMDVLLLWSMRNNMEKRKKNSYLTEVNITSIDKIPPDWIKLRLNTKIREANRKQQRRRFHISHYPIPAWLRVATRVKMEENFDVDAQDELPAGWDTLPYWTKELLRMMTEEMHGDEKVMDRKMSLNEILDYALWLSQRNIGWGRDLEMEDIPDWAIEIVMNKIEGKSEDKEALNGRMSLEEVLNYAIRSRKGAEEIKKMASRHTEVSEDELPAWVTEFLERTNVNEKTKPIDIPDWVAEIVKAELEQSRAERFLIKDYFLMKYLGRGGYSMIDKEEIKSAILEVIQVVDLSLHALLTKLENWEEKETNATRPKEPIGGKKDRHEKHEMVPFTGDGRVKGDEGEYEISEEDGLKKVLMVILNYADNGLHNMTRMLEKWQPSEPYSQRFGFGLLRRLKTILIKSIKITVEDGPHSFLPSFPLPPYRHRPRPHPRPHHNPRPSPRPRPPVQKPSSGVDSTDSETPVSQQSFVGAKGMLIEMIKASENSRFLSSAPSNVNL